MTTPTQPKDTPERVHISCPGCGRHDWVSWPAGQETLRWKCFNCEKVSELQRSGGH